MNPKENELPVLPSGPKGPGRFGAYYTTLAYAEEWDAPWRVGEHADVVVRFEDGGHRLVFWRGTSYIPCWVTENGIWYNNEFCERLSNCCDCEGCVEPMSDKLCKFSHVRIIENTPARVVIHWRYAPVDVHYTHPYLDEKGWGDWVDEYYTIYPDGACVRKITIHTAAPDEFIEWHEAIIINQPGTLPEDNIEPAAMTLANLRGDAKSYRWDENGSPDSLEDIPEDCSIQVINLKAEQKPFMVVDPRNLLVDLFKGHKEGSNFHHWDHWPVSMDKSWTRNATSAARPSHSSLFNLRNWQEYSRTENSVTRLMLNGLTDRPVNELTSLAASWLKPPVVSDCASGFSGGGYDPTERAYHFTRDDCEAGALEFRLQASEASPVDGLAIVVKGWGETAAQVSLDGRLLPDADYRQGQRHTLEGSDLVLWSAAPSMTPLRVTIQS